MTLRSSHLALIASLLAGPAFASSPDAAPEPGAQPVTAPAAPVAPAAAAPAEAAPERPRPSFRFEFGTLRKGQPLPEAMVESPAGEPVALSSLLKGGPSMVVAFAGARGPGAQVTEMLNAWSERYADQGLRIVGLASYGSRDAYETWYAANGAALKFPVVFDPSGPAPQPAIPREEMTDEQFAAFKEQQRAHNAKVVPLMLAGGSMAPIPHALVLGSDGNFVGIAAGREVREPMLQLLMRAGVQLAAEDQPKETWTDADLAPAPRPAAPPVLAIGALAPDFTMIDVDGKEVRLSDFRGKVVILDFWATWCGPCLAAMPHLQQVAAQYGDQGVVALGSGTAEPRPAFERWVRTNAAKYPNIIWAHDPAGRSDERASRALFGVGGIPHQFIIDREGRVVDYVRGYMPGEVILDAALAKAGITVAPEILEQARLQLIRRSRM